METNLEAPVTTAVTSAQPETAGAHPDTASIAALAYQLWLARGCPNGSDQEDWFLAEGMLKSHDVEPPFGNGAGL